VTLYADDEVVSLTWVDRRPNPVSVLPTVVRAAAYSLADRRRPECLDPDRVPGHPAQITEHWLGAVLGEPVTDVRYDRVSSGTSERGRLHYRDATGTERVLFTKATPTLFTRVANGVTATSRAETTFFRDLRPRLGDVTVPVGVHSAFDPTTLRSIHLIEDLVATRGASFPDANSSVTRAQAERAIDLLATIHRTFAGTAHPRVPNYTDWWRTNLRVANVQKAVRRVARDDFCPDDARSADALWQAARSSITMHDGLDATLLHGDPHPGNWFLTRQGDPGLLDWQCISFGHWSRDIAYAITTVLTVEQRRAWEDELLRRYAAAAELRENESAIRTSYRRQLAGGLLMWAPTLHKPVGFPDMQPRPIAEAVLVRILTALVDHGVLGHR
jgi:hypothetical protein